MIDKHKLRENQILDQQTGIFKPVAPSIRPGQQGVARLDVFHIDPLESMRTIEIYDEDFVPAGTYARLRVNGEVMMVDTPMEKRTNLDIVREARGRVLIAGLGIGMILKVILAKPEVESVLVIEKYQDVVDLVRPSLGHQPKLEVVNADINEWTPSVRGYKWHTIYFDIWPNSNVRHVPEMQALHKRFRPYLVKGGWMDSWTYQRLKGKQRDDARFLRSELPRTLRRVFEERGVENLMRMAAEMLTAPEHKIDQETKAAIRKWLADHHIELEINHKDGTPFVE